MKLIVRKDYLNKLIEVKNTPDIKVITGIRRCGKSKLLESFIAYLRTNDSQANIISINFNLPEFDDLLDSGNLYSYIKNQYIENKNNYVFIDDCDDLERKGAYLKENDELDNDLSIINDALINQMINKIPVEDTIYNCEEFAKFQKVCKLSNKYKYVKHNDDKKTDKVFRVFASKDRRDGKLFKIKDKVKNGVNKESAEKFANTPEKCFINNDYISESIPPNKLDRDWYVRLAKKRLEAFGISDIEQLSLF